MRLGWKQFSSQQDAMTHAANGGIAIYWPSVGSNAWLHAGNKEDFRKAARCLGISEKWIEITTDNKTILVGKPLTEALDKCNK
jgi:hypothetical protein